MMDRKRLLRRLEELCNVPSVSETAGEAAMPGVLLKLLNENRYFHEHPEAARILPVPEDPYRRGFVCALMRCGGRSKNTVILLSHFDVVGVAGYGAQAEYAFHPEAYTESLRKSGGARLPEDAAADLAAGGWLFGRGVMDMKFGIAADLEVLEEAGGHPDLLDGNLLFLSVPDEEASSRGMLAAVGYLLRLKEEQGLRYTCCLVTEPFFPKYPGDRGKYLYHGTIGKLLPAFLCVGKETHACEPFSGVNPNLLTARIIERLDSNPDFCDAADGVSTPPPVCLKASDCKDAYSVQTPLAAYAYFNFMTLSKTPGEVMEQMKSVAREAFADVLRSMREKAERFSLCGGKPALPAFRPRVLTWGELLAACEKANGQTFSQHIRTFVRERLDSGKAAPDLRRLSIDTVREAFRFYPDQEPAVVVFFCPPFYPHALQQADSVAVKLCRHTAELAKTKYGEKLTVEPVFPGLSDMSYLGLSQPCDCGGMGRLFPLWNNGYRLPLDEIAELSVPFLNIGPYGKDAHKSTERLCVPYSLQTTAPLILDAVRWLLRPEE